MTLNYQQVPGGGQDDILNTSALGAPAIIRGTVYAHLSAGVTVGAGQTAGVRTATGTALNAAISYASANRKFFEIEPGVYEINNVGGLVVPASSNGLKIVGSKYGTVISQFYATTPGGPIITVGDTAGATVTNGVDISGLTLQYGAAQTGFTSACPLVIGYCANGHITDININGTTNPGIDGLQLTNTLVSTSAAGFNLALRDITVVGFQRHGINYNYNAINGATAHVNFYNLYLAASAAGTRTVISGNYLLLTGSPSSLNFVGCTFAWGGTNKMVSSVGGGGRALLFDGFHVEGLQLTGAGPVMFDMNQTSMRINSFEMSNVLIVTTGSALTGAPYMFQDYSPGGTPSNVKVDGFTWQSNASAEINTPFGLLNTTALSDDVTHLEIDSGKINDDTATGGFAGNLFFDSHMPVASFSWPRAWSRYSYGGNGSRVDRAVIGPVSATYTHYGQHESAIILVPSVITSFTLTLATTMGATGTQVPRPGTTVRIRRLSTATATGTLTVNPGAMTAPNTAGTDGFYVFDGTNWATKTTVT